MATMFSHYSDAELAETLDQLAAEVPGSFLDSTEAERVQDLLIEAGRRIRAGGGNATVRDVVSGGDVIVTATSTRWVR